MRNTYDPAGAAAYLSVSTDSAYKLIHDGLLPASNIARTGGKARWRVTHEDLVAFLASRRTVPPPKPAPRRQKPTTISTVTKYY